jgi:hypothetical protein
MTDMEVAAVDQPPRRRTARRRGKPPPSTSKTLATRAAGAPSRCPGDKGNRTAYNRPCSVRTIRVSSPVA